MFPSQPLLVTGWRSHRTHRHTSWLRYRGGHRPTQQHILPPVNAHVSKPRVHAGRPRQTHSSASGPKSRNHESTSSTPSTSSPPSPPRPFQNTAAARPPQMSASPFHTPFPLFFLSSGSVPIKHVETIGGVLTLRLKGGAEEEEVEVAGEEVEEDTGTDLRSLI